MKKVDSYIDSIYKDFSEDEKEILDGKQEMKSHLLQSISDIEAEGFSETESIDIAIKRFGDVKQIKDELGKIYKIQKNFLKKILIMAKIFLIIACVAFIFKMIIIVRSNNVETALLHKVTNSIKKDNMISKDKLKVLYEDNKDIKFLYNKELKYLAVYKYPAKFKGDLQVGNLKKEDAKYIYPSLDILNAELKRDGYIANASTSIDLKINKNKYLVDIEFMSQTYNYGISVILNFVIAISISIYWVLFGVWAIMKAQNEGNCSLNLFFSFFLFNIFGYSIYESSVQKKLKI